MAPLFVPSKPNPVGLFFWLTVEPGRDNVEGCRRSANASSADIESARDVALAYCHGTPLRNEIESRDRDALDQVTDRATGELEARFGSGPITGKMKGLVITASR